MDMNNEDPLRLFKQTDEFNVDVEPQQHLEEQEAIEDAKKKKDEIELLLTDALDEFYDDQSTINSSTNTAYDELCSNKQVDLSEFSNSPQEYLQSGTYDMQDQLSIHKNKKDEIDIQLHSLLATQEQHLDSDVIDKDSQLEVLYNMRVQEVQDLKKKIQLVEELSAKSLRVSEKKSLLLQVENKRLRFSLEESQEAYLEKLKKIDDLHIEIDDLNSFTETLRKENKQLNSEKNFLKNSIIELETKLKVIDSTPFHPSSSSAICNQNQSYLSENQKLQTSVDNLSAKLEAYEKEKSNLLNELQKKKDEYERSSLEKSAIIKELSLNIDALIRENSTLTETLSKQNTENTNLRSMLVVDAHGCDKNASTIQLEESNKRLRQELSATNLQLLKSRNCALQIETKMKQLEEQLELRAAEKTTRSEKIDEDETMKEKCQLIELLQKELTEQLQSVNSLKSDNETLKRKNRQADALIGHLQKEPQDTEHKKRYESQKRQIVALSVKYENLCRLCDKLSKHNVLLKTVCDVDCDKLIEDQSQSHSDSEVADITKRCTFVPVKCFRDQMKRNAKMLRNEKFIEDKLKALSSKNRASVQKMVNSWKHLLEMVDLDKRQAQLELQTLGNQMQTCAEEINGLLANNQELKNELRTLSDNYNVLKDSYVDANGRVLGFVQNNTLMEIAKKWKRCSTRADLEVKNIERYYELQMASLLSTSSEINVQQSKNSIPTQKGSISTSKPEESSKRSRPLKPKSLSSFT